MLKLAGKLLKFALPFIIIFMALRIHVALGLAIAVAWIAYVVVRNKTAFYAYLGNVNYQQGKQEDAVRWLTKAAARQDCRAAVLIGFGYFRLKRGDLAEAEALLDRARSMKLTREERMNADSNYALLLWKKGRLEEALTLLESLYAEYKTTNLYSSLGYFYILQGELDKALDFNKEAYDYNAASPVITDNLGQTHLLRGEYDEALSIYEQLSGMKPTFPEAFYNHGLVLEALGRKQEALELMNKALEYPVSLLSTVTKDEIEEHISSLETEMKTG